MYLHENHLKKTAIHVGNYINPMDPMGIVSDHLQLFLPKTFWQKIAAWDPTTLKLDLNFLEFGWGMGTERLGTQQLLRHVERQDHLQIGPPTNQL